MADLSVVILAAGEGTRMRSKTPKVLHPLCGRPLVLWPVLAAKAAGASRIVVVDGPKRPLEGRLPEGVDIAIQEQPRGTGDAMKAAAPFLDRDAAVVVLYGDVPLITPEAIDELRHAHETARAAATMATMILEDPTGYGRVVRTDGGDVERVVETKKPGDATPEQLAIDEVNTGIFCFDGGPLLDALEEIRAENAQGEYYLPDVLPALRANGHTIGAHVMTDHVLALGINDRVDLATVGAHAQRRINERHMRNGVTIVDPASTTIDADVEIGQDTVLEPGTHLRGATRIGADCRIGPSVMIVDATVGDDVSVGPFAYLRPKAELKDGAKAGTFVEIKNSVIGPGSKVPHLSYIGDADVGAGTNLGAATITANYDGRNKHRTTVGDNVRGGVDVTLVAPVTVGDDAVTGAGSVITGDVPPGALGIARERQRNIEGYARRRDPGLDSG